MQLQLPKILTKATALVGIFTYGASYAEDFLLDESDLFAPVTQVQSVTGLKQKLSETPASTTIIDQALIQASGAVNIIDVLRFVPGFQVFHVTANKFGVVSHGQGEQHPGRLEVMIDGRSVYLPLQSTVDWTALGITLDDIDYIEVVRGSNTPTQGSNAFLGSINIITKEPFKRANKRLKVLVGTDNYLQSQFQTSGRFGEIDYGLSGNFSHNKGFGPLTEDDSLLNFDEGGQMGQFNFRGTYTPTLVDSFDVSFGYSNGESSVGRPNDPDGYGDRAVTSHYQSLKWNRILNSTTEFQFHGYHNYLQYDHDLTVDFAENQLGFAHPAFSFDSGYEDGTSQRLDLSVLLIHELSTVNRLVWGAGIRHEEIESAILFGNEDKKVDATLLRVFGNLEHTFNPKWVLNAGAMVEHSDISNTSVSPRIGVNFKPKDGHIFRGITSLAYRTPSLLESNEELTAALPVNAAFGPFSGYPVDLISQPNPDLKPERLNSFELGYSWVSSDSKNNFDLKLFYEKASDVIDQLSVSTEGSPFEFADSDPKDVREYQNNAYWKSKGFDIQYHFEPTPKDWFQFAFSYVDTDGQYPQSAYDEALVFDAGRYLPEKTLAAIWSHKLTKESSISWALYSMSDHEWHGSRPNDHYNRLDFRFSQKLPSAETHGEIEFIVHNVLDKYSEFNTNNVMDTKALLRLTLDF